MTMTGGGWTVIHHGSNGHSCSWEGGRSEHFCGLDEAHAAVCVP